MKTIILLLPQDINLQMLKILLNTPVIAKKVIGIILRLTTG